MIFYVLSILFGAVRLGLCIAEFNLPLTTCKRSSSNYTSCLRYAIQSWPRFVQGIPELYFPPLDPFFYGDLNNAYDGDQLHINASLSNMTILGLTNTSFSAARAHFFDDMVHLQLDSHVPYLFIAGDAITQGSIGPFNIASVGQFNYSLMDIKIMIDLTGHVANDRWTVEHFRVIPSLKVLKLSLDWFDGNKDLSDIVASFVNEYWPALYRVALPEVIKALDPQLANFTNIFFSKVSFSKIFPE